MHYLVKYFYMRTLMNFHIILSFTVSATERFLFFFFFFNVCRSHRLRKVSETPVKIKPYNNVAAGYEYTDSGL